MTPHEAAIYTDAWEVAAQADDALAWYGPVRSGEVCGVRTGAASDG